MVLGSHGSDPARHSKSIWNSTSLARRLLSSFVQWVSLQSGQWTNFTTPEFQSLDLEKTTTRVFPKIVGYPQIIHGLIGFSIIFTIHFGVQYLYFWKNDHEVPVGKNMALLLLNQIISSKRRFGPIILSISPIFTTGTCLVGSDIALFFGGSSTIFD